MLRNVRIHLLLAICFFLISCSNEQLVRKIPLQDFFRNPEKTSFQLSPDGRFISFLKPFNNRLNIYVQNLENGELKRITSEEKNNVSFYCWASNNKLLFHTDNRGGAFLYRVNKDGSNFKTLVSDEKVKLKWINPRNILDNKLLIALNKRDSTMFDAYVLDVANGDLKLKEKNPGNIFHWFADQDGKLRMALASDGVNETLLFRADEGGPFKPVVTNNFKSRISPVGFCDSDKQCIYARSNINRDKFSLVKFNCRTGKEEDEIFSHPEVDVSEANYSYRKRKLMYVGYETWKRERVYIDDFTKSVYASLQKLLPNTEIVISDQDSANSKFIVKTFTDKIPGVYYLYTPSTKKLVKLSELNPSIRENEMCAMKPVSFKSRDGLVINGYLTLPLGYDPANLPTVVLPHGGPSGRNSWGFSSEVQFLANRGYAVFQINFRGSDGYGKKFWTAGFKKWGTAMQNDITDGVKWLIGEGIADKKRIAIYGSGYGGLSALHGACFQPDLYACAASQGGIINLFTYLKAVPPYFKPTLQMYYEMVGSPETDLDYLREASPVFHANKIKAPVLIAQDAKDPRVKINETNQFVKELRKRGVPVTYIVGEKEKYSLRNPENRFNFYHQLEMFLEKNLKMK